MQVDVLTIGDALIDSFLAIQNASKYCEVHNAEHKICFDSGSKILVDSADFLLGGNACNVAVGLSRLSLTAALAAEIGTDEFSEKLIHGLTKENVQMDILQKTQDAPSTFSVCLNFQGERTLFVRHVARKHDFALENVSSLWVYLTSLGNEWKHAYAKAATLVKNTGVKLAFNPGSMQIHAGRESFKEILRITDVLFVNKEEAEEIVYGALQHTDNSANSREVLVKELQKLGPKMVCLTDGEKGSYVQTPDGTFLQQPCAQVTVVEKTGAGDAYASGFLGALIHGKTIEEALMWGTINSASVIQTIGAQAGLLTKEQIEERMRAK